MSTLITNPNYGILTVSGPRTLSVGSNEGDYILEITEKQKNIKKSLDRLNKELETLNSLHPATVELVNVFKSIQYSTDVTDLIKIDKLVRDKLFNQKMENL